MNDQLRKYLLSLNCKIINPVMNRLGGKEVVGWHCKSTSNLRKDHHLKLIRSFIMENNLKYYLTDGGNVEFFIYNAN